MTQISEPWASIDDVAAHLGVRKDSVYRWIEKRGLPATKIGKLWRMKLSEVDAWMRTRGSEGDGASIPIPASVGEPLQESAPARVVMLVDDDHLVRASVADFLEDKGYCVLLASDGEEALRLLSSSAPRPSVILLDLDMPRVDGWQFRKAQLEDAGLAAIPVVVVTGTSTAQVEGVRAILRKPLRLQLLAKTIESLWEAGA